MASSKTSSSFYNMPHRNGTYMASHGAGAASEVTPDLHLKMSKKIAQLTKVIYALNTKNDEHDAMVETIKKSHEQEIQQLIAETKNKIDSFKTRLNVVCEQKERIESLESIVSQEKLQREEGFREFEQMKRENDEKYSELRAEYSDKMLSVSKEMLSAKKDFQERLKDFQAMRRRMEKDRDKAVDDLSSKHHEELENLMKAHRVRYDEITREKQQLGQQLKELEANIKEQANSTVSLAIDERKKMEKESQEKVEKLKVFYEKELSALCASAAQSKELNSKTLDDQEKQLKAEWNRQERSLKERISELLNRQSDNEHEISDMRNQIIYLQSQTEGKTSDSEMLSRELKESKQAASSALSDARELQNELLLFRRRCDEKAAEIARQSTVIGKLEANKLFQETNNSTLKTNINELIGKQSKVEKSYEELEQQYKSHFAESGERIHSLEEKVEQITKEKKEIEGKYLRELNNSRDNASERENNLRKELVETISSLKTNHKAELENLHQQMQAKLTELEQDLRQQAQIDKDTAIQEKTLIIDNLENQGTDLQNTIDRLEAESKRLYSLVQESEKGLGSASSNLDSLKQVLKEAQDGWDGAKQELKEVSCKSSALKSELENQKNINEHYKIKAQRELQTSLESVSKELDDKWTGILRDECSRLRAELNDQHSQENRAALEELTKIKDKEFKDMKNDSDNRIDTLRRMVKDLQDSLEKRSANASNMEHQLQEDLEKQRIRNEEEMARLSLSHTNKITEIQAIHLQEQQNTNKLADQKLKDLETTLRTQYQENLASSLQANKVAMDALKSQIENAQTMQLDELHLKHREEKECLRKELICKQQANMQQLNKDFETQMMALKLQLQRTNEIITRQEAEYQNKVDDISQELQMRDVQLKELDHEISALKSNMEKLQEELQSKGQEILTIRREANSHIRKREEHLGKLHQKEVDSISKDYLKETQVLVEEFNRAKELQNAKISALHLMLEEAEIRFKDRESRLEDLDLLDTLKRMLAERELEMKKLMEEKRYFQMELLNRETNFNKVFSTSPHVGVINPLNSRTRVKTKTVNKTTGLLVASSRLDPIPNMPVHEKRLNNTKPLPPTPPKDTPTHRHTVVY